MTITYEKAKELADNNFPFRISPGASIHDRQFTAWFPTLSELIEACSKEFGSLVRSGRNELHLVENNILDWTCWNTSLTRSPMGNTPEEAVANLWLELNSK